MCVGAGGGLGLLCGSRRMQTPLLVGLYTCHVLPSPAFHTPTVTPSPMPPHPPTSRTTSWRWWTACAPPTSPSSARRCSCCTRWRGPPTSRCGAVLGLLVQCSMPNTCRLACCAWDMTWRLGWALRHTSGHLASNRPPCAHFLVRCRSLRRRCCSTCEIPPPVMRWRAPTPCARCATWPSALRPTTPGLWRR